ncbi:PadR family transcriptional regulator [Streptococcus pneumoniae]|nr:PadR family transcriptional regulator [Streptococcus pneumoniae]
MKETQLLKGVLEGCVLDMIGQKERYGYELVQTLREAGFDTIVPGTIYPLLQKLEKNQWIRGDMRPSPDGPDRKYFSLMKNTSDLDHLATGACRLLSIDFFLTFATKDFCLLYSPPLFLYDFNFKFFCKKYL